MVGFFFRHFSQHRSRIISGRCRRCLSVRLAGMRRRNRRALESLRACEDAAAAMEEQNRRIRREIQQQFVVNSLADSLVHRCLVGVENDPLMRDAFQSIDLENLRNLINMIPPQLFPGRPRRRR
ncbi:hypothetical protein V6N13_064089 [Hibiscus sabdariffa]|uniref:Uncharacterized protein n=1 Tax=Hibiscus sabdariffa TaxID=183260 RepID=A0ABR2R228_9ROSI